MLESEAYKTYHAYATGEKTPKPKKKKADSESSPKEKPAQASKGKDARLTKAAYQSTKKSNNLQSDGVDTLSKVPDEQPLKKSGTDEGAGDKPEVPGIPEYNSNSEEESWTFSDGDDDDDVNEESDAHDDNDQDEEEKVEDEEKAEDDEDKSDKRVHTPPDYQLSDQMTDTYFVEYTGLEVQYFRDTLLQHLGNVKKSVAERTRHQRQYERRVNKRQMQTQESKIDTGKALDADLVDTESIRTDSTVQDDSSRSGNDTDDDDADIRPIYDEEPMAEVQLTAECNIFAIGQHHTEQPEIIVEGRGDQYPETCQVKSPMLDSSPDNHTTEYSKQSLQTPRQHGQILNETSNKAKIEKEIDVLETMNIELEHSVATLRKEKRPLKRHYKICMISN
ncbi:hypothetical protein Tco_0008152 [Tanacetum coccineum]